MYVLIRMRFAWDEDKNTSNFYKHGLWLEDAWAVFQGPMTIRVDDRRDYGETRYVALGCLENTIVFLAYAFRGEVVRVISMRRANKAERKIYEAEAQV
ncbi:BrnT family toxin [Desulfolutivibrio sp.]|uniref:BrnT family toxin n=1 Tax=Desulfolutivibrio sp. TaxID=2773296 RepID=UPI002F96E0DD